MPALRTDSIYIWNCQFKTFNLLQNWKHKILWRRKQKGMLRTPRGNASHYKHVSAKIVIRMPQSQCWFYTKVEWLQKWNWTTSFFGLFLALLVALGMQTTYICFFKWTHGRQWSNLVSGRCWVPTLRVLLSFLSQPLDWTRRENMVSRLGSWILPPDQVLCDSRTSVLAVHLTSQSEQGCYQTPTTLCSKWKAL